MSTLKEIMAPDELIICINCGCEPENPDEDHEKLDADGWRVTEFGVECPPCSRTEKAVDDQRKADQVQDMTTEELQTLAAASKLMTRLRA